MRTFITQTIDGNPMQSYKKRY